ncbi:MAG: endonuclease III, partial [Sulfuricella sp.]|nr:endonuclease III [Sulfuricella sp.]
MNAAKRREIFTRFRAANPKPTTELAYRTPFELLVAVVLSAQATDKSVNLATAKLFPVANTPQKMLSLGQAGLESYVKSIGLYKSKAKHLIATCRLL